MSNFIISTDSQTETTRPNIRDLLALASECYGCTEDNLKELLEFFE